MDLSSGYPFSLIKHGYLYNYPSLKKNISCDVAIIGGGISGALTAYYLNKKGISAVVVEKGHIGLGSTALSTSLIQYEVDEHLCDLKRKIGVYAAETVYKLCVKAVFKLSEICKELKQDCGFSFRKSIYLAKYKKHIPILKEEERARRALGIDVNYAEASELKREFNIHSNGGLISGTGAELDAFKFTHEIFQHLLSRGCGVYDKTEVTGIEEEKNGVRLKTKTGIKIKARKFVFATGYESHLRLERKMVKIHSTYTVISSPLPEETLWKERALIWETARPYLYLRTTEDNRIIIGGRDDPFYSPEKRDRLILKKSKLLLTDFQKLFPYIPFEQDFSCAGSFVETKDGLPYVGTHKKYKHAYFALGFGGNGITFSQIAGEIISDLVLKRRNPYVNIFSFDRNS